MTENSSLFSLQQLTQQAAAKTAATRDEESGLIDLKQIEASGATPGYRVPPVPAYQAPPPLRLPVEESTLNAMIAVSVEQRHPRLKWAALLGGVCLLSVGLGSLLLGLGSKPTPAPASAPLIIYAAAPVAPGPAVTGSASEASPLVPSTALSTEAGRKVNTEAPVVGVKGPSNTPSRRATTRPSRNPAEKASKAPPSRSKPTSKRPADPCAHCAGDLSCAMRCSVTRP